MFTSSTRESLVAVGLRGGLPVDVRRSGLGFTRVIYDYDKSDVEEANTSAIEITNREGYPLVNDVVAAAGALVGGAPALGRDGKLHHG